MEKPIVGFNFAEIPLEEAENVVAAGEGKYSSLVVMLSQKLPEIEMNNMNVPLKDRKGFAFGLPNGKEVDEKERRGLCHTINLRLNRQGIGWKITYSGNKKLFICVPSKPKTPRSGNMRNSSEASDALVRRVRELKAGGLKIAEIAKTLGKTTSSINYWLYKKPSPSAQEEAPIEDQMTPKKFIELARSILQYKGLLNGKESSRFRTALAIVGYKDLKFKGSDLDTALGYKKGAQNWLLHHGPNVDKEVQLLRQTLKEKGVLS